MSNKEVNQVVPREVRGAIDEVTREILRILKEKAGLDISAPNTEEGRRQFKAALESEGIEFEKIISADRPEQSGTRILKHGIQIGLIPALGVVASDGKRVIV